ncbi:Metallo-dependent phosphatase-like protein [Xylaria nigripes]|nr:Metallo-dependent phosphatase-like protein [Xylaria nigripes]
MASLSILQLVILMTSNLLAQQSVGASVIETQSVLQPPGRGDSLINAATATSRRLHGKFLHITDLHPDEHYKPYTSTKENIACHRRHGIAGVYGAETSDCDSPMSLVNATLAWVREHLKDEIDFVVWTGDSARHDSDEKIPRHNKDILAMNRRITDAFVETFSDDTGLVVPVVPTFGNNDIYPHNILMPGPNDILRTYNKIWKPFIPEAQRNSFEFGGWFYVEVIPNRLAVFSLNTMYFFERNAGMDDCAHPSEHGYKHFEWLRVQLGYMRARGMKAILMGHVPPARTPGKQLWHETCWQKYTLWLQQYRDVVISSLYGHMNLDHFLLQDTRDIDMRLIRGSATNQVSMRETVKDEFAVQSRANYLRELCDDWSKLPSPIILDDTDDISKKGKKNKDKFGGEWAERFQLTFISPSIVPNYFPSIRVFEYNITGLEDTPTWVDVTRGRALDESPLSNEMPEVGELKKRQAPDFEVEKMKRGRKGRKLPADLDPAIPDPPAKGTLPGPAYRPQALTLLGYTQYYANLTEINNDITSNSEDDTASWWAWSLGKHKSKSLKNEAPQPREFQFEVEYSTFDDKIYRLQDLTVRNLVKLAYRIGQVSAKSSRAEDGSGAIYSDEVGELNRDDDEDDDYDDEEEDEEEVEEDTHANDLARGGKKNKKKKQKGRKVWLHFLKHAFVSTKTKKQLRKFL